MKKKNRLLRFAFVLAFLVSLGLGNELWAATYTWTTNAAGGAGSWNTATNWTPNGIPGAGDDVVIPAASAGTTALAIGLANDVTVNNVTVTGSAGAFATTIDLVTYKLTLTGNLSITGGANAAANVLVDGTDIGADLVVAGNVTLTGATGNAEIRMTGTGSTLNIAGNLDLFSDAQSILNITGCDMTLTGTWTRGANAVVTTTNTTNITFDGSSVVAFDQVTLTALNKVTINKTGIGSVTFPAVAAMSIDSLYVLNGNAIMSPLATRILTIKENLYIGNDPNVTFTANTAGLTIENAAYFGADATILTNSSTALVLGTAGTETADISLPNDISNLASLVINRAAASTVTLNGDLTDAGVLTLTKGKLVVGLNTLVVTGALTGGVGSTFNISGSTVTLTAAPNFTNIATITNSSTNVTVGATPAPWDDEITELNNLTLNNAAAITGLANLTLTGALTLNGTSNYTVGAFLLTVNGATTGAAGTTLNALLGDVIFNGPINHAGTFTATTADVNVGGTGAITAITFSATVNSLTMNRPGMTLSVPATFTVTTDLTITSGIVSAGATAFTVSGNTVISSAGKLSVADNDAALFTGSVSGAGTLDATGGTSAALTFNGAYNFTGNFITTATTALTFGTSATDVILQSSVSEVSGLTFNRAANSLTLSGNLKTNGTGLVLTAGTIIVGANTLDNGTAFTGTAAGTLNINNSNVIFRSTADFTLGTYIGNNATNLTFYDAVTKYPASLNNVNNLTLITAGVIDLATDANAFDLTVNGNLEIGSGCSFTTEANRKYTVMGTFSNAGTFVATSTTDLYLYGAMSGTAATWTTPENINLFVLGTGAQLSLPAGITDLRTLVLNRANGMKINANITGAAGLQTAGCITLTSGDLDLNGYNVTLGAVAASISENVTGGATVVNTGSDGAYIQTAAASSAANVEASGIGITTITGGTALQVKRFPKARTVAGVNLSVARYFQITTGTNLTALTFKYDNTELGSNSAGSLKLYYTKSASIDEFLNTALLDSSSTFTNTPGSATGTLAVTAFSTTIATTNLFYAIASQSGSTGVVRIFNNAGGDGQWTTASNWNPAGVPTIDDDVTIGAYPVTISGNGITYYCKSLVLASSSSSLQPYTTVSAGDTVNLVVMGNIQISNAGGNIDGANGYGRLNIQIGDGVTPVTSTISPAQDYSPLAGGNGFSAYNLIVNSAAVTHSSNHKLRINKNVNIEGTSVFSQSTSGGTLVMYGGSGVQTIAVASIASLDLQNLELENSANVTTASNFILRENIKLDGPNDVFTATNGTINFQNAGAVSGWSVFPGATMKLWNAEFTGGANYTPSGDAQIQGDFTFSNSVGTFIPANGTVLFSGSNLKNLVNTAAAASLQFYHLAVAPGASVATSSDFQINGDIDVQTNASFVADNGTIEFPATAPIPSNIKNASDHTLIFNNLTIADAVNTSDSWKISGNLVATGTLTADNGTITFKNDVEKSISGAGTFNFFKLSVADQSAVTTGISLNIRNNSTNSTGAGLEVLGTGSFKATANTVTFTTASDPGVNNPKTISKSSAGTLQFFNLAIGTAVNNEVTTTSNFEILGGASAFVNNNAGLGGLFTATTGTVTFSGVGATITSTLPEATSFNNILASNVTLTVAPDDYLNVTGNIVVNGASGLFNTGIATGATGLLKFNGIAQQLITGTSTQATPITLDRVEINKTTGTSAEKSVVMELDITLRDAANSLLRLNSGYLNLGNKVLTVGQGPINYTHLGAINGATGTYKIANTTNPVLFRDELFTVDAVPTLYNLIVGDVETLDGNLTVNGTLSLTGAASDLDLGLFTLTQLGNLTRTTGTFATAAGKLVLAGNGSTTGLSNSYFGAGVACNLNLEVARTEALTGNFTMAAGKDLTINTGIGQFDLSIYKLTSTTTSKVTRVSGAINAGTNSTVEFGTDGMDYIPANLFVNNTCYNIIFNGVTDRTLGGDLRVEGTMNMTTMADIITGDNVLTFGPSAVLPAFTSAAHVIGNLRRTVTSSATRFDVGDGVATDYRPLELNFSTTGNTQEITVSAKRQEPTVGKAGNPKNAVDVLYTFTPVGTDAKDSLKVKFQWTPTLEGNGQLASITNASFPAKWENNSWVDYRNRLLTFTSANPRVLTMSGFPVANPAALKGEWAIFNATANTNVAKDNAISKTANKVVITKINPNPVALNKPFKVTVQLQDQYGQPITVTSPFYVTVSQEIGTATLSANITGVITAGNSYVELTGLYTGEGSKIQLKADTTNSSDNWQPQVSSLFNVLSADPTSQARLITLTNIANTSATIKWTDGSNGTTLLVIKADTLLIEGQEYPVSGTSYTANSLFGAGSPLGNAVVLYNSTNLANGLDVKGLSPNTTYYVYAFTFTGSIGTENYKLSPASGNPKILNTTGSTDDDVAFGTNNTRATSKTIGTNTPVTGTIGTSTDEDWFNFSVTSTAPNVKSQLYGLGNNYNLEVYDASGRRIRRGIRTATGSEGPVVNDLPAGTYTVRIYSADGSYSSTNTYTLKVGTKSSEIFSVTP